MKIGIIVGSLGFGGAERTVVTLSRQFLEKGHQVVVFTTKQKPDVEYPLPEGAERIECCGRGDVQIVRHLKKTLKGARLNIALVMSTPMCVYAVPALLGLGIPFVVSERSAPNAARIRKTTKVLSGLLNRFADGYVFQTQTAKEMFPKSIQKRGTVIYNPIQTDALPEVYTGQRQKKIVAVGRLIPEKNVWMLIDAFELFAADHPHYVLDIYGDGALHEELQQYAAGKSAYAAIRWMGKHPNVWQEARTAEIYVLSSNYEGMPNALIEAMAMGVPSIATNCPSGGPAALIQSGSNGLLVEVGNAAALAEAMAYLADNAAQASDLAERALLIREKLSASRIADQWLEFFMRLVK